MKMRSARMLALLGFFAFAPVTEAAAPSADAFWSALSEPGVHVVMRHALAPGGGDPAQFDIDDPMTQRRLSDAGREQSRRIGAAFRENNVAFEAVLTSQWDRCRETAALLDLGAPRDFEPLNSFFRDRSTEPAQTAALRAYLRDLGPDRRLILVTHWVNVGAFLGQWPQSGEAIAFRIDADGETQVVARLAIPAA